MLLPIPGVTIAYCSRVCLVSRAHVPFRVTRLYVEQHCSGVFHLWGLAIKRAGTTELINLWPNDGSVSASLFSDRVYEPPSFGPVNLRPGDELHLEVENLGANSRPFDGVWQGEQYT